LAQARDARAQTDLKAEFSGERRDPDRIVKASLN
jgi:hypothetical protein